MKKLMAVLWIALVSSVLVASASASSIAPPRITAQGEVFTHSDAGLQFTLPKGWKATPDGTVITVGPADDSVQMVFWVPEQETFDAAVKELENELGKIIKNVKVNDKGKSDTHNGMPHYSEGGTGEVDGVTIEWSVDVLAAKKPVIILTFAAPQLFEKHADAFVKLIQSIKKTA